MNGLNDLYSEPVYRIPAALTLILKTPLEHLSEEGRTMVQNLLGVMKTKPAPVILHCTEEDLNSGKLQGNRIVAFGHQIQGLPTETVLDFQGGHIILTLEPQALAGDTDRKKKLWSALQPWLQAG